MRRLLTMILMAILVTLSPLAGDAQDSRAPAPTGVNPTWVSLADNITRLTLAVDQILPLHGRIVPLAELHKRIGR